MSRPAPGRDGGAAAPAPRRRIGLELEFPVVARATGRGMDHATAARLWPAFAARDASWTLAREEVTGITVGVTRPRGRFADHVNTDTGICTVELSLAPAETVGQAVAAAHAVLRDLRRLLDPLGHTVLSAGIQPRTWFDAARKTRKDWYLLLARRWHYHHWFVPIASHQVSVDVTPHEAARAVNVLGGFAGVFTALTAGSPIARGRIGSYFEEHAVDCYVENRTSGVAPPGEEGVAAALTLGLVERLDEAEALLHKIPWDDWRALWIRASRHGLEAEDAGSLARIRELLELAADGLRARGAGEETHLAPLFTRLARRETPADRMLAAFRAGGVPRLLDAFGHTP